MQTETVTSTEKSKIDGLKISLSNAEKSLESIQAEHSRLESKKVEIRANLPGLKMAVEDAERRVKASLADFVLDESKGAQLEKSRKVVLLAQKSLDETEELLEAVEKILPGFQGKIVDASNAVQSSKHELWGSISKEFAERAKDRVGDLVERAWIAALAGGGAGTHEHFLAKIFPKPRIERIQSLQAELK